MPALDSLMLFLLLGFIIYGFLTGVVRQVLLLVSIYGAAVAAGTGYPLMAQAIRQILVDAPKDLTESISLFFLFPLIAIGLYIGFGSVFSDTRPASASGRRLDRIVGAVAGAFAWLLFFIAFYASLTFFTLPRWPVEDTTRLTLRDQVSRSALQRAVERQVPVAYLIFRPWMPRGLPGFPNS
jgi:uncharacterized membrane protein required for colicin V production